MATPKPETPADVLPRTVLRAICIDGERVEPGATVLLGKAVYTELFTAGKVGPHDPKAEAAAEAAAKAKVKVKTEPVKKVEAPAPAPAPAPVVDADKPAADLLSGETSASAA